MPKTEVAFCVYHIYRIYIYGLHVTTISMRGFIIINLFWQLWNNLCLGHSWWFKVVQTTLQMSRWSHLAISLIFIVLGSVPTGNTGIPPALINVDVLLFSPTLFCIHVLDLSCFQAWALSITCHGICLWLYTHCSTRLPKVQPCKDTAAASSSLNPSTPHSSV